MKLTLLAARHAPAPAAAAASSLAVEGAPWLPDWLTLIAALCGLIAGGLWRAGFLHDQGKNWNEIGKDMITSLLAGGANAVLALLAIDYLEGGVLLALSIGTLIGATGVRAILFAQSLAIDYLTNKFGGNRDRSD